MRSIYKIIDSDYPSFITSTIINWIPVFTSEKYFMLLLDNLKFYQWKYDIEIIAFVFMDNHFHIICKCEKLRKAIQSFKSYTAKKIIEELKREGNNSILNSFEISKLKHKVESRYQVWQEGFHPQQIINIEVLNQKIEYIHYNPVKRGLVENPEDWRYSSAVFYIKDEDCGIKISPYY